VDDVAGSVMGRAAPAGRPRPEVLRPILSEATATDNQTGNDYRTIGALSARVSRNLNRSYPAFAPQSAQDFASGCTLAPQCVQCLAAFRSWPHCGQNLALVSWGSPQAGR